MEADDVLADHVQVGRPVLPQRAIRVGIAALGDVVGERVQPDIHDVFGIAGHRDAPGEAGARHRQVLQAAAHEAHHLVAPALRCDEAWVFLIKPEQPVGPGRQLEEVRRLLDPVDLRATRSGTALAVGADLRLALDEIGLVAHRVPAGVAAEIDVARGHQPLPQRLAGRIVARLGRADEVVRRVVHRLDEVAERLAHLVGEGLRLEARGGSGLLDLLAVLVGAGQEMHVAPVQPHEAGQHVAGERRVGMPDMGHIVHVVDGRGDVIGIAAGHGDRTLSASPFGGQGS